MFREIAALFWVVIGAIALSDPAATGAWFAKFQAGVFAAQMEAMQ